MEKRLELLFKTGDDKNTTLTVSDPASNLTQETIRGAMDTIASLHLFEKDGILRYSGVRGARYVTREVEEVFTNEDQ